MPIAGQIPNNNLIGFSEEALQFRNALVHDEKDFSIIFTGKITKSLEEIIKKIRRAA